MFFDFVRKNSRMNRKENRVYFISLILSIVAFYVILSLGEQDVMLYLKTIESDAVSRLLMLIPILYMVSLFFVFFLVYFANRYQLEVRSHEFGLYLMMGMKRSKLFAMIMGETLWNGLVALIIGIPISLFLTEITSLTTSRLIGLGIIGHEFRISWLGLGLTIIGFFAVQFIAMFILSLKMSRQDPIDLLNDQKEKTQRIFSPVWSSVNFLAGVTLLFGAIFLCIAYGLSVLYFSNLSIRAFTLIMLIGISGTFILFRGLASLIGLRIHRKGQSSTGLFVFTGRQLQENVLSQWGSLALSSLLILMAMVCLAYGTSTALSMNKESNRTVDFTFRAMEDEIVPVMTSDQLKPYVDDYYLMEVGLYWPESMKSLEKNPETLFSWWELSELISKEPDSSEKENILSYLSYNEIPYFISQSSYNRLLQSMGKPHIELREGEVALYSGGMFESGQNLLRKVLQLNPTIQIDQNDYRLSSTLCTGNIVADRAITLTYALVVPDGMYKSYIENDSTLWNMLLKPEFVQEKGLMQAMFEVDELLNTTGLNYESYLASMGRQLFYTVAGSYLTFYLGLMFLIIANTVLGLKFLMQQKNTKHRYITVAMLGASAESLRMSARKQIWLYFGLAISVALVSSIFGIWSMIDTFPSSINLNKGISTVVVSLTIFVVVECLYIWMIQRKSDSEINKLTDIE